MSGIVVVLLRLGFHSQLLELGVEPDPYRLFERQRLTTRLTPLLNLAVWYRLRIEQGWRPERAPKRLEATMGQ